MDTKQATSGSRLAQSRTDVKTARRADALFRTLSTDYLLREQFVTDPAQILSEYLGGPRPSDDEIDAANQMIFAVMSNPRLRDWMINYAGQLNGRIPSRHEFALAFAKAHAAHGDDVTTLALIRGAADGSAHFTIQADLLRALVGVLGGHATVAGTEMSPGTATEMSPGIATERSAAAIFRATEMSPGTATEMSPGKASASVASHLAVTLGSLVQYSNQLRARGALLSSGLEDR